MARLYQACSILTTHKNSLSQEAKSTKDKTSQKQALSNLMNSNKALYDKKIDLIRTDAEKLSTQLAAMQTQLKDQKLLDTDLERENLKLTE
jgi:aconitase B